MTRTLIEQDLRALIARETKQDLSDVGDADDLLNALGIDSLTGLNLLAAIEDDFDMEFADWQLGKLRSLSALAGAVKESKGEIS